MNGVRSQALERNAEKLEALRAGPREVQRIISRAPWAAADLALALDLESPQEAQDVMLAFGFEADPEGRFRLSGAWESILPAAAEAIALGRVDFNRTLSDQLEFLIGEAQAGRLPSTDWARRA